MNYPFILKFTAVKNLSDARYAAGNWADFVGFCFNPDSEEYIEPGKAKEISSWINGPLLCGEFSYQTPEWISDFKNHMSLKAIEIPADYKYPEIFEWNDVRFILRVTEANMHALGSKGDLFITSDKELYAKLKAMSDKPVIFEQGEFLFEEGEFDGIAFTGGKEDKPGTRNQIAWTNYLEKWEDA